MAPGTEAISFMADDPESDVAILHWPDQQQELNDLALRGIPRLLLVSATSAPPTCTSCLEDWVRLPVDETDLHARLVSLAEHRRTHTDPTLEESALSADLPSLEERRPSHARPTVDQLGVLRRRGAIVFLSPRQQTLAEILIAHFDAVVCDEMLEQHVFSHHEFRRETLRMHASQLRKRIVPLGLTISRIRNVGYMMHDDSGAVTGAVS